MKPNFILSCILFIFLVTSCKQEAGEVQQENAPQTPEATTTQAPEAQNNTPSPAMDEGHDYTFLTDKLFHFKASFGGTTGGEPPYKNEWIDLESDGTYKHGKLKEQTHTGKWSYNNDKKILLLRPDSNTFKITEWKVMYNEKMMVWVGTQTYGNNATQVQLERSAELP